MGVPAFAGAASGSGFSSLGLTFINHRHMEGVMYMERNQEDIRSRITTMGREKA